MYVRRNPEAIFDRDIKQRGAEADLDCWSHTERTDAIPPCFVGIPGSADYCGSGSVVADIAQRSLTNSRDSAGVGLWCCLVPVFSCGASATSTSSARVR